MKIQLDVTSTEGALNLSAKHGLSAHYVSAAPNGGSEIWEFEGSVAKILAMLDTYCGGDAEQAAWHWIEALSAMPLSDPPEACETCGAKTVGEHLDKLGECSGAMNLSWIEQELVAGEADAPPTCPGCGGIIYIGSHRSCHE